MAAGNFGIQPLLHLILQIGGLDIVFPRLSV
jgi:hypothetical protein